MTGTEGSYQWLTTWKHDLEDLVAACPEVFLGRYLAITSSDSGSPEWWAKDMAGWTFKGGIGYSPRLESVAGLQCHGFDEWSTFETAADLGERVKEGGPWVSDTAPGMITVFVNHYFVPSQICGPEKYFWRQIQRLQPESYISDGSDRLSFVTRNPALFEAVKRGLNISA